MSFDHVLIIIWFYEKKWIKNMIFKLKMILIKSRCKPMLKWFINKLKSYKNNFETWFSRLACFTKNWFLAQIAVLDTFFKTWLLHGRLLKLYFLDYDTVATRLSRGIGGELMHCRWKFLHKVWLVYFTEYLRVALGFIDKSTVEFKVFYGVCMIFHWQYYFIIIFWETMFLDN